MNVTLEVLDSVFICLIAWIDLNNTCNNYVERVTVLLMIRYCATIDRTIKKETWINILQQ